MSKKVLVISTSLRNRSNSERLAEAFLKGAEEAGHQAEMISLKKKEIQFCQGCLACQRTRKCMIPDDSIEIVEKMKGADVIAFATPIYYYEMCGQMKTLLDRANPLYACDYQFRDIYLLMTAAEEEPEAAEGAIKGMEGWVSCFEYARLAGTVFGGGADEAGSIEGNGTLDEAYELGKAI